MPYIKVWHFCHLYKSLIINRKCLYLSDKINRIMALKRISREKAIEIILKNLFEGSTRPYILAEIGKTWTITERSFARYWSSAQILHQEQASGIQKEITATIISEEKKAVTAGILTKHERLKIASSIANGKMRKSTVADRIRALDFLAKVQGDYAPEQIDMTSKIAPIEFTILKNSEEEEEEE